ncbi:hypothetical protein [Paenibacillus sp. 1P07SE]
MGNQEQKEEAQDSPVLLDVRVILEQLGISSATLLEELDPSTKQNKNPR